MHSGMAALYVLNGRAATPSIPAPNLIDASCPATKHELLTTARNYAETAATRDLSAKCAMMLVNFQKFLVLCVCAVLSQMQYPKDVLVDITRVCFGDISGEYAARLWRTAVFLNQLVDGLNIHGWGNRASELLLICKT